MIGNYWLLVHPETRNPIHPAHICWAYYPDDRPTPVEGGLWIEVKEIEELKTSQGSDSTTMAKPLKLQCPLCDAKHVAELNGSMVHQT